jgi:glycosyltransferase involved in cell wall biosynthesis
VANWLHERGHGVTVVTMADRAPDERPYSVRWVSRRLPRGARHALAASTVARGARSVDVVYTTGMLGRTTLGAALARKPVVLKLTSDPAFERSLRWGLTSPSLELFQSARGIRIGALRRARDLELARATTILVPSRAFAALVAAWGIPPAKTEVLPNPVVIPDGLPPREEARRRAGFEGPTLLYAGRLVPQKSLDVALEAVRRTDGVSLVVAGDGPERARLESLAHAEGVAARVEFLGWVDDPAPVLASAACVCVPSRWDNAPLVVGDALLAGRPVVGAAVGGIPELLGPGDGTLFPADDPAALARALEQVLAEPDDEARRRERALLRFGSDRAWSDHRELYESVS